MFDNLSNVAHRGGARRPKSNKAEARRPVERAYIGIRQAILDGVLEAGEHLREEHLAAMRNTSRTPVREALRQLVADGLARADGRRRFVSQFSYDELVIMFDVRARLESYAAGVAATKIKAHEIARLEQIIDGIDVAIRGAGAALALEFNRLNAAFHNTIIEAAASHQLRSLITPAFSLPLTAIKQFLRDQDIDPRRSNTQHRDILAALKARNVDWAASAMQAHVLSTKPMNLQHARSFLGSA